MPDASSKADWSRVLEAPARRPKRRSRARRRRERPLPEVSPLAYDEKHAVREAGADLEPMAAGGILGVLGMLRNSLAVISGRGPVLEDAGQNAIEGEILPPLLSAVIPPATLPAAIPRRAGRGQGDGRFLLQLPPGVSLPYADWWRGDSLPGQLRGIICEAAVTVREDGGTLTAGHCGRRCEPDSVLCREHLEIEQARAAIAQGNVPRRDQQALGPAAIKTNPRPPSYW
jgi:hypothetical protein